MFLKLNLCMFIIIALGADQSARFGVKKKVKLTVPLMAEHLPPRFSRPN